VPYKLTDMAADGIGLLDHLGIAQAHILGASMGGMIVQTMAIEHPDRVASMTSVMSTTGERDYGQATPDAMAALLQPPPADRDAYIQQSVASWKVFASKKYYDPERIAQRAAAGYDRMFYPEGVPRQLAGILASGDRAEGLPGVTAPTLVLHGRDDTLITPSGGERPVPPAGRHGPRPSRAAVAVHHRGGRSPHPQQLTGGGPARPKVHAWGRRGSGRGGWSG
jgi:pimeloyl-ACP methyl ester carboxylesterase